MTAMDDALAELESEESGNDFCTGYWTSNMMAIDLLLTSKSYCSVNVSKVGVVKI
jgi:hypothetical protein